MRKKRNMKNTQKNDSADLPWKDFRLFMEIAFSTVKTKLVERGYPGTFGIISHDPFVDAHGTAGIMLILMPGAVLQLPLFHHVREKLRQDHIRMVNQLFPDIDEENLDIEKLSELLSMTKLEGVGQFAGSDLVCPRMLLLMHPIDEDVDNEDPVLDIAVASDIDYRNENFAKNEIVYPFRPDKDNPEEAIYSFLDEIFDDFLFASWNTLSTIKIQDRMFPIILNFLGEYFPVIPAQKFANKETAFLQIPSPAYIQPGHAMRKKVEEIAGTFSHPNFEEARFTLTAKHDAGGIIIELRGPDAIDLANAQSVANNLQTAYNETGKPIFKTKIKMADFEVDSSKIDPLKFMHKITKKCRKFANDILKALGVPVKK